MGVVYKFELCCKSKPAVWAVFWEEDALGVVGYKFVPDVAVVGEALGSEGSVDLSDRYVWCFWNAGDQGHIYV